MANVKIVTLQVCLKSFACAKRFLIVTNLADKKMKSFTCKIVMQKMK
jgi:hypothetical protein